MKTVNLKSDEVGPQLPKPEMQQVGVFGKFNDVESADKCVAKLNKSKSELRYKVQVEDDRPLVVLMKHKKMVAEYKPFFFMPRADDPRWMKMSNGVSFFDTTTSIIDDDLFLDKHSTFVIHFTVWLEDGSFISSTRFDNRHYAQKMSEVCEGLRIGLTGMYQGGIRFIHIPYQLSGTLAEGKKLPGQGVVCMVDLLKVI